MTSENALRRMPGWAQALPAEGVVWRRDHRQAVAEGQLTGVEERPNPVLGRAVIVSDHDVLVRTVAR